jgi:hypothetical protein
MLWRIKLGSGRITAKAEVSVQGTWIHGPGGHPQRNFSTEIDERSFRSSMQRGFGSSFVSRHHFSRAETRRKVK